jgi:hypothetical protein
MTFQIFRAPTLALVAAVLVAAAAHAQTPVEAFGDLPAIEAPALSPDGKRYATVQSLQGKPIIAVFEIGAPAGTRPLKLGAGDGRIATMAWVSNEHLIVILKANMRASGDNRMRTWWRSIGVNVRTKTAAILMNNLPAMRYNFGVASVADLDPANPGHVYMPLYSKNWNLYRVNVNTGEAQLAYAGIMWTSAGSWTATARWWPASITIPRS